MLMKLPIKLDTARKVNMWNGIFLKMIPATKQQVAEILQVTIQLYWIHLLLLLPVMMVRLAAASCSSRSAADRGIMMVNTVGQQLSWFAGHWFGFLR